MCNPLAVAVIEQRWNSVLAAHHPLFLLAPARVGDIWLDVGLEAVLMRCQGVPEGRRFCLRQLDLDDGLRALEAVLPRGHQPQGRAVLLIQWMSIGSRGDQSEFVGCLG